MPATINRKLAAVHSFLKWSASMGFVSDADRPDMAERQRLAPRWLDEKEQHRLKKSLEMKGDKLHQALSSSICTPAYGVPSSGRCSGLTSRSAIGKAGRSSGRGRARSSGKSPWATRPVEHWN